MPTNGIDDRTIPRIRCTKPTAPPRVPKELDKIPHMWFVTAYGFRGDTRHPRAVQLANGFMPNNTRKEHLDKHDKRYGKHFLQSLFKEEVPQKSIDKYVRWAEDETGQ